MCIVEVWSNNVLPNLTVADEVGKGRDYGWLTRIGLWKGRRDIEQAYDRDPVLRERTTGPTGVRLLPRHLHVIVRRPDGTVSRWEHWGGHDVPADDRRTGLPLPQYVRDRAREGASTDPDQLRERDEWESALHFTANLTCPEGPEAVGCSKLLPEHVLRYQFRFRYPHSPDFRGLFAYRREKRGILRNAAGRAINSNTFVGKLLLDAGIEGDGGESVRDLIDDPTRFFPGLAIAAAAWDYGDGWPRRTHDDWEREGDRIEREHRG